MTRNLTLVLDIGWILKPCPIENTINIGLAPHFQTKISSGTWVSSHPAGFKVSGWPDRESYIRPDIRYIEKISSQKRTLKFNGQTKLDVKNK